MKGETGAAPRAVMLATNDAIQLLHAPAADPFLAIA
jgi:hypothetical protein